MFFTTAVVLSAAYGGLWAGVFTTLLSVVMVGWLFEQSIFLLTMSHASLFLFAALGITISAIIQLLHRAKAQVVAARAELEEANKQLLQRTQALTRSNEELQGFAYAVSHDLREPLRNISMFTTLVLRRHQEILDEESREYAQMIVSGVRRMEARIKALLEYAAVTNEPADWGARSDSRIVFELVLSDLRHLIEAEKAVITSDELPVVQLHQDRLAQVLLNLITNGIKYRSPARPAAIHISAKEKATEWVFAVRDNGIGIDMKHAEYIFGLFKRLHSSEESEGSGIGLAISKAVIERNGGTIWVESEPGKGSTFFFTIPKVAQNDSPASTQAAAERQATSAAAD